MAASFVGPCFIQSRGGIWTDQQAIEHTKAAANLHRFRHEGSDEEDSKVAPSHQDVSSTNDAAYNQVKARYQESEAQLLRAQFWAWEAAEWIKWIGVVFCFLGALGLYFFRTKST